MMAAEVSRMPKVTLYVKDADAPIWERARQLAGDSLSSIVSRALAAYVDEVETKTRAEGEIAHAAESITLDVEPEERPNRKVRFIGVLAHEGSVDAYVTTSGKVVIASYDRTGGKLHIEDVRVFDTYQDFLSANPDPETAAAVAEVMGEDWIEEID